MKYSFNIAVLLCVLTGVAQSLRAQVPVPPPMPVYQPLSDAQLDQLLGPIALYPDPLLAQILPASTFPTQIVLADRYVTGGGDPNQIDQQPWDASVQALARYSNVLKWMDDNLSWTTELGQAFLNQQHEVMASIQRLRQSASQLGNLQSTPQQQVVADPGDIEIVPADPQVIYVPIYQPDQVYYQTVVGAPFVTYGFGWPVGPWLNCDFDWGNYNIIVWDHYHPRPPNWWHEPYHQREMGFTTVWHPDNYTGAAGAYRGDRGWNSPGTQPVVATVSRSMSGPVATPRPPATPIRPSVPVIRSSPVPVQHYQTVSRPQSNGAFIGIQSSSDTRTYSARGQQSMQTMTHATPVSRPAASSVGGGARSLNAPRR